VITDVEALPDGRFNIVLRGLVKFRVAGEDESRLYRLARVNALPEATTDKDKAALHEQRQLLEGLMAKAGSGANVPPEITDEEVVNALAQYVPLDPPQHQALLELEGAFSRSKALIGLLESMAQPPR
jgi:Lon protease-like protein